MKNGGKKYNSIYNRIRYLIGFKSSITYVISQNYGKNKKSFPLKIALTLHDVILLIKSVFNKDNMKIDTTTIYF